MRAVVTDCEGGGLRRFGLGGGAPLLDLRRAGRWAEVSCARTGEVLYRLPGWHGGLRLCFALLRHTGNRVRSGRLEFDRVRYLEVARAMLPGSAPGPWFTFARRETERNGTRA